MRRALAIVLFVLAATVTVAFEARTEGDSVEVWIRSFIPNEHDKADYVVSVPRRPGETMIPGPLPSSDCFLTDQRGFSRDPDASSRLAGHLKATSDGDFDWGYLTSESVEVDCEDGDEECRRIVDTSRSTMELLGVDSKIVRVSVHGEANNACFRGSPDIHFEGEFLIDFNAQTIAFKGTIGQFPAFEAVGRFGVGPTKTIFDESPVSGSTAFSVPLSRDVAPPLVRF